MNTLTKKIVKRALSAFLSVLIVCSLFTVGFTSASAADVEVAPTGADTITVYFQNNWKWSDVKIYCWNSSENALAGAWPGTAMTLHENDGTYDVYKYTLPANTAGFIFNGIKDDGSGARDQSPDITSGWIDGLAYYMKWGDGNQIGTYDTYVEKETLDDTVTATVTDGALTTIGNDVSIKVNYDYSNADGTAPKVYLYNADDDTPVEETIYSEGKRTPTECEITIHTITLTAKTYSFYARVQGDEVSADSEPFEFTLRAPLSATLSVTPTSGYVNGSFEFTVTDNATIDGYGTPTYALYKDGGIPVQATWNGNKTKVELDTTGEQNYYATVTVEGYETVTTDPIPVTVNAFTDFRFDVTYRESVQAGETITITASLPEAVPYPVTFVLTDNNNPSGVKYSEDGKFSFTTTTDDIGTIKSFTLTAYAKVGDDEVTSSVRKTVDVAVTNITDTHSVTIYFKSTDTLGYAPVATVTGMKESKTNVYMEKAAYITANPSGTAQYWWYSIDIEVSRINPRISFNVLSDRYDMEHTVEFDATNSEYWFATDNLNTNQTIDKDNKVYDYELVDVSDWPEAKRNWTQSAAHMLWDDEVDDAWVENGTNGSKDTAEVGSFKTVFVGDANNDGVVNIKDATYIQKSLAGLENADYVSRAVSDVDGDSMITIKDATALQKKLVVCL